MLRRIARLFCFVLTLGVAPFAAADERPNFIVINVDDLGYADIGPFGSNNRTPNLDRMAREGRKLTSHYAAPVCSPSRASLLTGCYPKRCLPIPHVLFPAAAVGLHPDEVTVAEVLKGVGYATACFGKWHLGDQAEFLPTKQGFDEYFGIPYSNDMGPAADGSKSNPGKPLPTSSAAIEAVTKTRNPGGDETGIKGAAQPPLPLVENDKVVGRVRVDEQFDVTRRYTERAVKFVRDHADQPFFLYLPHTAVHFPLYPSEKFKDKSPNGLLGDWAEEVDWSVGQVLDAVREQKLDRKTLVLFTSDNGGSLPHGSNNAPLRGSKGQTFEGGIRVCTIAWRPGTIPAGTATDAITTTMDLLPTLAAQAGAKLPVGRKLDGVDVTPVLVGDPASPPRTEFLYFRGFQLQAVRQGPWKLHLERAADGTRNVGKQPLALYNLADDVGESKNLADAQPEIVARLQRLADATQNDLGLDEIGPGCRPLGRVADPLPLIDHDGTVRADAVGAAKQFP
jgi:arylsulfatase A-like enzyme